MQSVAGLLSQIRSALRWAGKHNPNRVLLEQCTVALTEVSMQLHHAKTELARVQQALADHKYAREDERRNDLGDAE